MTKTDAKLAAQDWLMDGLRISMSALSEDSPDPQVIQQAIAQFRRIEKLFGYEPGSYEPFI